MTEYKNANKPEDEMAFPFYPNIIHAQEKVYSTGQPDDKESIILK